MGEIVSHNFGWHISGSHNFGSRTFLWPSNIIFVKYSWTRIINFLQILPNKLYKFTLLPVHREPVNHGSQNYGSNNSGSQIFKKNILNDAWTGEPKLCKP